MKYVYRITLVLEILLGLLLIYFIGVSDGEMGAQFFTIKLFGYTLFNTILLFWAKNIRKKPTNKGAITQTHIIHFALFVSMALLLVDLF